MRKKMLMYEGVKKWKQKDPTKENMKGATIVAHHYPKTQKYVIIVEHANNVRYRSKEITKP